MKRDRQTWGVTKTVRETLPERGNMPVNHERGTGGGRERERGGDCCKQGFAAEGKERKGAVALSNRVLHNSHAHILTNSVSSVSLSKRVSQPVSRLFVCVCVCGDVEKSSKPSFISMTDGKFISFTLSVSPSESLSCHVRPACVHSTFFSHVCVSLTLAGFLW